MKILLAYATNSGGTFLAGRIIREILQKKHAVQMKKIDITNPQEFNEYDLVIFGSPSWDFGGVQGQPHETFLQFMAKNKEINLEGKNFAVFGCGDHSYTYFCGGVDNLEKFIKEAKGKLIIKSLKIDGYFFNLNKNARSVKNWAEKLFKAAY
jgi:flavodoxin I